MSNVSVVRLRHNFLKCLLTCTNEKLPNEWGFSQQEIACGPWQRQTKEKKGFRKNTWIVEDNDLPSQENEVTKVPIASIAPGFWEKMVTSHRLMLFINSRLGEDKSWYDINEQIPIKWPFDIVMQIFSSEEPRIYLLGNPFIWAVNFVCLVIFPFVLAYQTIKKRKEEEGKPQGSPESKHFRAAKTMFVLWALHYLPFFMMFRVLYIHHYYPAMYFSSLLSGVVIDWIVKTIFSRLPTQIMPLFELSTILTIISASVGFFWLFSPLVYGMRGDFAKFSNSTYHHLYWTEWWDF